MEPSDGLRNPEMTANSVVLPAPFGPISPVMRPSDADNEAALTASRPPKRCDTPSTASSGSAMGRLPRRRVRNERPAHQPFLHVANCAHDAAPREGNDQNESGAIGYQIEPGSIAGDQLGAFAEGLDDERAEQRAEDGAGATDDRRQERLDRNPGAVSNARIDKEKILGVKTTGRAGDGG